MKDHHQDVYTFGNPEKDLPGHPGKRGQHAAVVAPNGQDMYVFGGFRWEKDRHAANEKVRQLNDLWCFSNIDQRWRLVDQATLQGGRANFGMVLHPWRLKGDHQTSLGFMTFGGKHCNPTCGLTGNLSFYSIETNRWYGIHVREVPTPRYQHALVVFKGALWTFGGKNFSTSMYHNSVQRIVLVPTEGDYCEF